MARNFTGSLPQGASVTSGTISATTAITAGHITVNSVAFPALAADATAAARCDSMVALFNQMAPLTGVFAEKVTATTFRLKAAQNIVIAALGATATVATSGLTAGTTTYTAPTVASTRKAFGSNPANGDTDVIKVGAMEIDVASAKKMGIMSRIGSVDAYLQGPQTPTRTDA
jgi:hypothetical protein